MKCIVTAGPTYEEMDQVRRLTNFSTGALGTALAEALVKAGHEVEFLRGYYATAPVLQQVGKVQTFTTTVDLSRRLQRLAGGKVGAVFHAAAVNDFSFGHLWRQDKNGKLARITAGKVSTQDGTILAELIPAPKLIGQLRGWFGPACLVGWKYEVDGKPAQALERGRNQIVVNKTDYCVVNGPAMGRRFSLLAQRGSPKAFVSRTALVAGLVKLLDG